MIERGWRGGEDGSLDVDVWDGALVGVGYAAEAELVVRVRRVAGGVVRLQLAGVREMRVSGLSESAVVACVTARRVTAVPPFDWQVPDRGWSMLLSTRTNEFYQDAEARRIAARAPEPLLVVVEWMAGGGIAAVCDALRVFDE